MAKTVWILGAGFSRSLGGPLLFDLFSEKMRLDLEATYRLRPHSDTPASWFAFYLYHWGTGNPFTIGKQDFAGAFVGGSRFWGNAEEYLDRLDHAVASDASLMQNAITELGNKRRAGKGKYRLKKFLKDSSRVVEKVLTAAKQWMAAECCVFLANSNPHTERWEPYRNWAHNLTADDTIVTFNYDRVLETLAETIAAGGDTPKLEVVMPNKRSLPGDKAPVLKLHGSVDWKRVTILSTVSNVTS